MTPEQQAAFIMAQSVWALGKIAGLHADNQLAASHGQPPRWLKDDFEREIVGLGHNDVVTFFQR